MWTIYSISNLTLSQVIPWRHVREWSYSSIQSSVDTRCGWLASGPSRLTPWERTWTFRRRNKSLIPAGYRKTVTRSTASVGIRRTVQARLTTTGPASPSSCHTHTQDIGTRHTVLKYGQRFCIFVEARILTSDHSAVFQFFTQSTSDFRLY